MKNMVLVEGECALCHGSIDEQWAGPNPGLGSVCRKCFDQRDRLFGPENVELVVKKWISYNPIFGTYEYHFDWTGTKVMINGKVGTIIQTYLGSSRVKFPGEQDSYGSSITNIDYWRLLEIYKASGAEFEPPPLPFEPYTPTKTALLDKPILEVVIRLDKDQEIDGVQIGRNSTSFGVVGAPKELPVLKMFHAFTNLYVRFKYGLAPNFCAEGGFLGDGFEIRNSGFMTGAVGISVRSRGVSDRMKYATNLGDLKAAAFAESLIGLMIEKERSRPGVVQGAGIDDVLTTWIATMSMLLRYDWWDFHLATVENTWQCYCRMQDVLLNLMPPDELATVLEYCRNGKMQHCGSSY